MNSTFPSDYDKSECFLDFALLSTDLWLRFRVLPISAIDRRLLVSIDHWCLRSRLAYRIVCQPSHWYDPSSVESSASSHAWFLPWPAKASRSLTTSVWSVGRMSCSPGECRDNLWSDHDRLPRDYRAVEWSDRQSLDRRICNDSESRIDIPEHRVEPLEERRRKPFGEIRWTSEHLLHRIGWSIIRITYESPVDRFRSAIESGSMKNAKNEDRTEIDFLLEIPIYFALKGHSFDHEKSRILSFTIQFIDEGILRRFEVLLQFFSIMFEHSVVDRG